MAKTHILHLRRHLAARHDFYCGVQLSVPSAPGEVALVGNGVYPDGEAHLNPSEYSAAEDIGKALYCPDEVSSVLICPSPLPRAKETALYMFNGMMQTYAQKVLGVPSSDKLTSDDKNLLSERGLHKLTSYRECEGVTESDYKNAQGESDEGNELVAQAYNKTANPSFGGYRWMVQKGFENDPRSEHPQHVAQRALKELIPYVVANDLSISATHQPNLEIITAQLVGDLGSDANELFENAGGAYGMGGGLQLTLTTENSKIVEAKLVRTTSDPYQLDKELKVDHPLNAYL